MDKNHWEIQQKSGSVSVLSSLSYLMAIGSLNRKPGNVTKREKLQLMNRKAWGIWNYVSGQRGWVGIQKLQVDWQACGIGDGPAQTEQVSQCQDAKDRRDQQSWPEPLLSHVPYYNEGNSTNIASSHLRHIVPYLKNVNIPVCFDDLLAGWSEMVKVEI